MMIYQEVGKRVVTTLEIRRVIIFRDILVLLFLWSPR